MVRIAILGWGSLLWDRRPEFDDQHGDWCDDGPPLKLEFSRVSSSRKGALTLVVDEQHGALCGTSWCLSRRRTMVGTGSDLRKREGTTWPNIGALPLIDGRTVAPSTELQTPLGAWVRSQRLDGVVWTALKSNYQDKTGRPFSVVDAVGYLRGLDATGKAEAVRYVHQAPPAIRTPLRSALAQEPWFQDGVRLLQSGDGCEPRGR